ncbi:MAG TPA: lyase family protein [Candidatus Saccharimonadales bacterium]|nr:lyase family protein [Candidatus Saccharimonadales bacterium]
MKPINLPMVDLAPNYSAIDPIDARYYDTEIACYLSERSRVAYQAYVEVALAYALADAQICSREIAEQIEKAANKISAEAVDEAEKTTKHDIKALVNVIKQDLPDDAKPFVHFGATSYDIVATALSLQLRDATIQLVIPRLIDLQKTLLKLTKKYAETVQIGRTHGQHAVPITFGFAMAEYVSRLGSNINSLKVLSSKLKGKFSGAVGAYNALSLFVPDPIEFEKRVLDYLQIEPASYSSQIIPAEGYVRLIDELVISAGIMANLSHDMRHLQRNEIAEVREAFEAGQAGSSTMAHKRNPWNFENVISLCKQVTAQNVNANLNLSSEHQRDLTDSASARYYGLSLALVASMANRLNTVMSKLEVDEEHMRQNLHLSQGAIAAEPLYLLLEKYGHTTAHEVAKALSHQAIESGKSLYEVASGDNSIAGYFAKFTESEKKVLQSPETNYTGQAAKKALAIHDHWQKLLTKT